MMAANVEGGDPPTDGGQKKGSSLLLAGGVVYADAPVIWWCMPTS